MSTVHSKTLRRNQYTGGGGRAQGPGAYGGLPGYGWLERGTVFLGLACSLVNLQGLFSCFRISWSCTDILLQLLRLEEQERSTLDCH